MKKKLKLLAAAVLCIAAFACEKSDDTPQAETQIYKYTKLELTYGVTNSYVSQYAPEVSSRTLLDVFDIAMEITDFSGNTTIDTCKGEMKTIEISTPNDKLPATCSFHYIITRKDSIEYGKYGANMQLSPICEAFSTKDKPMSTLAISQELKHWEGARIDETTIDKFEQSIRNSFGGKYTLEVSGTSEHVSINKTIE